MRASALLIIAEIFRQEYNYDLFLNNFPSKGRTKHQKVRIPYYSRVEDKRVEIYGSKRRNTTRR